MVAVEPWMKAASQGVAFQAVVLVVWMKAEGLVVAYPWGASLVAAFQVANGGAKVSMATAHTIAANISILKSHRKPCAYGQLYDI